MASSAVDSVIHGFLFSTDEMREIFSDKSWARRLWPRRRANSA